MAMMPGLQINVGQNLKLTPQLQQSIKILQYSALEVQQTIEQTMQTNFMLEVADDLEEDLDETLEADLLEEDKDEELNTDVSESQLDLEKADNIDEDLEIDCDWQEVYSDYEPPSQPISTQDDFVAAENYTASHESLYDKLQWQLEITSWQPNQREIAEFIIDHINEDGFLTVSVEEIMNEINTDDFSVTVEDVEVVLSMVQQFEPNGVAARDLQETLLIQLDILKASPIVVTAKQVIKESFDWLSSHDYKRIKKRYKLNDEALDDLLRLIQTLNPRPGCEYSNIEQSVIIPDLLLFRQENGWKVELNPNVFPKLRINPVYIDLAKNIDDSQQSQQIKEQMIEARGLIKGIQNRGETLLRVGEYIVQTQARFFEEGEQAMQPMVLRDVAEALDLHESTISRATNQKYIQTPRGTYELKYFFSTGVTQYGSEDQSSIAIKSHIKEFIDGEDPAKPLSDNKLMQLLEDRDITIARRTVAKYREALGIPSSSERKKLNAFKKR